jgi:Helix-turn-helix domain
MAISTVAHVRQSSKSIGSARLLLLILASHVSPTSGYAWPSVPTLAFETKLSVRHVYRLIKRLESLGELAVERRPGCVNRYRIAVSPLMSPHQTPTHDIILAETPDISSTSERRVKGDVSQERLKAWLTPGSRIYQLLSS